MGRVTQCVLLARSKKPVTLHCFFHGSLKAVINEKSETEGNPCLKSSSVILIFLNMSQCLVNKKIFVQRELNKIEMHDYF